MGSFSGKYKFGGGVRFSITKWGVSLLLSLQEEGWKDRPSYKRAQQLHPSIPLLTYKQARSAFYFTTDWGFFYQLIKHGHREGFGGQNWLERLQKWVRGLPLPNNLFFIFDLCDLPGLRRRCVWGLFSWGKWIVGVGLQLKRYIGWIEGCFSWGKMGLWGDSRVGRAVTIGKHDGYCYSPRSGSWFFIVAWFEPRCGVL